jgi:hypothetical protein
LRTFGLTDFHAFLSTRPRSTSATRPTGTARPRCYRML